MRFWIYLLLAPLTLAAQGDEEALFLRRIAEFWQEGEYHIAKSQMEEFITEFPESAFSDPLCAALGDLSLREKNYSNALSYYSRVQPGEFSDRVFLNRMQCLYELQWYATLAEECETYLQNNANLHVTYYLAISLYHQCLNVSKDPEALKSLALRAKPYFEALSESSLSNEVAQGFAHLCYILKDYEKASQIYLDLAKKDPLLEEEMLFQVALIQSEYDKNLAIETFAHIMKLEGSQAKQAAYNKLVLLFEQGRFQEISESDLFNQIPSDKSAMAKLFLGRSFLHLKKYPEAVKELKNFLEQSSSSESAHTALLSLIDAAYQSDDLQALDQAIEKLAFAFPQDAELPKAYFSRAQVLKKAQNHQAANHQLEELLAKFPQFTQKAQVLFELAHLDFKAKNWQNCYAHSRDFLDQFREHDLTPFAWGYFIFSSSEIANQNPSLKEQLLADLEEFFQTKPLSEAEMDEWKLIYAKTQYEMLHYEKAIAALEGSPTPNSQLLLALCHRDGRGEIATFCQLAETALSEGANLIEPRQLQISLFNAYLQLEKMDSASEHLYAAFQAGADIKDENLLWLADIYYNQILENESNFVLVSRAAAILEKLKCKAALHSESLTCKLAKLYTILGRTNDAIALLEALPSRTAESELLLGESYAKKGKVAQAVEIFDSIVAHSSTVRSFSSASAALQAARLKIKNEKIDLTQIASQLKNLIVQKTLANEPLHLEAALEYVDLQAQTDLAKRMALLNKTKWDFERTDDLLSKDYHEARVRYPQKDKIYQGYMRLIEAEILAAQAKLDPEHEKDLQAKSKDLLLQIMNEPNTLALHERVRALLTE